MRAIGRNRPSFGCARPTCCSPGSPAAVAVFAAIVGWVVQILPEGTFVETLDRLAGADRSDVRTVLVIGGALLVASILISLVSTLVVYWDFGALR
jgi:hypothetical protein